MSSLDSNAIPFLLWVLVVMPAAGIASHLRLRSGKPLPPKKRRYWILIALQVGLLLITLRTARATQVQRPSTWPF